MNRAEIARAATEVPVAAVVPVGDEETVRVPLGAVAPSTWRVEKDEVVKLEAALTSRHEALHLVGARRLGRTVVSASRDASGKNGEVTTVPRLDGDVLERGVEAAVIAILPFMDGQSGCGEDLVKVAALLEAGVPASRVLRGAREMLADPAFRSEVRAVEWELCKRPRLSGADVQALLA